MDGNVSMKRRTELTEVSDEPDEDIIHLLNTKKQKSREILSITNAAADAVSNHAHKQEKRAFGEDYSSQIYAENKENNISARISDSFLSTGSRDGSFSGQQRVRIPSCLLREIKSPQDRSSSGNVSSSESKDTSSGSLFASQSSSEQSSIQATGPVPTVIKYSCQPAEQYHPEALQGSSKNQLNDTPVVIKYLQEYTSPNSKDSSSNSCKSESHVEPKSDEMSISTNKAMNTQAKTDSTEAAMCVAVNKSPKTSSQRNSQNKPGAVEISERRIISTDRKGPRIKRVGLHQGAPSSNLSYSFESKKGQVKAVSFDTSDRGKATKDMLAKRQEHGLAVRRVIQPRIIEEKPVIRDQKSSQPPENPSKEFNEIHRDKTASNETAVKLPNGFEEQMKDLKNTLGSIESQCQENRVWRERQQQEIDQCIKQRDERRLQHLEEMQKQLLEYQLRYAQPITAQPQHTYPVAVGDTTTQGQSTLQVNHKAHSDGVPPQPRLQALSGHAASQNLPQGLPSCSTQYTAAAQHKTQPSFKTTVYSKPSEDNAKSGVKRKLVRNTRTQTSPQVSNSSSETSSSPLDTPLPRRRHPVPMTRDWKSDRGKKHVHFDAADDDKNTGKSLKKKADAYAQAINKARDVQLSQQHGRQETSIPPRSPQADYIVNDISRLRQELRSALNETEQTKQSLKNLDDRIHSQISSSDESVVALPDHSRSYPLDAYLRATRDVPKGLSTPKLDEDNQTETKREKSEQEPGSCAYALSVLRDVQKQKENLEWNLLALSRRHDEQDLYNLDEDNETNSEALRIRKNVAKKIQEIDAVVQAELLHEERQRALENQVSLERPVKQQRSTRGVPLSTEKRAKLRNVGKENTQSRLKTAVKTKVTKPTTKPVPLKQPVAKRPDHVTRRTTIKPNQDRYQPPGAVKPSSKNITATKRKSRSPPRLDESTTSTLSDDYRHSTRCTTQTRYYFQPDAGPDQSVIDAHFRENQGPLPGHLLPMAIPLGKPRMDPALRLPVCIDEEESRLPRTVTVRSDVKQSNVAVITLKDDQSLEDFDSGIKKPKRSIPKKKERVILVKQTLPNVDIDTSAVSELSSDISVKEIHEPTILPMPDPLPRPDASEYEEFQDYEHVRTVGDDQDSDKSSVHGGENVISLHGESRADKPAYQGPAFPPQSIPTDLQQPGGFRGPVGDLRTPNETVEHKARELIEQELLARVVSEMAPPPPDPTSRIRDSPSAQSFADSSDNEPDLAATIGLRGIQLFVDAGIPVDADLVRNLIMEVLQEKVSSMVGYPKPQEQKPAETQEPEDDYTEPESGSEDYSRVQTPVRTPSTASQHESRPLSHVSTPEQTQTSESSALSSAPGDVMGTTETGVADAAVRFKQNDEVEEGPLDDSDDKSPIATPVVTPSPPQSVMLPPTPDVSEHERVVSEEKLPVETPDVTVSTRDKSSEESPKDLEADDLKEQTLVEDDDDDQDTGTDIPVIKFELEPEPSEVKVTNSPSSITTTTYSTHSTMGTVATDDEISEGEQLQPYVHVGQYSEGEFVAPSTIAGNMTTLHEVPDDIFDTLDKTSDPVKQAFHGLLKLDDVSDGSTLASEENTNSEGQRRIPHGRLLSQSVFQEDRSEGEVADDVVSTLLTRIRQSVWRGKPSRTDDDASVGEVEETARQPFLQRPAGQIRDESDISAGEFAPQHHNRANVEPLPMQTLDRTSVLDSDENNNDSQQSSSISEVPNQTWDTNIIMVTPKKVSAQIGQQKPNPSTSYFEQSPAAEPELHTTFPRVVQVTEARHVSTPAVFSPSSRLGSGSNNNVTDLHVGHVSDLSDHVSDNTGPKHVAPEPRARIQLTLPSADPSVSLLSEGMLGSDDSAGEISSISLSGGEI